MVNVGKIKNDRIIFDTFGQQIASVRVKLNQLKEELEETVKSQNFEKAAEIKAEISECETERNALLEVGEPHVEEIRTEKVRGVTAARIKVAISECDMERNALLEVGEPHVEEIRTEKVRGVTAA